MCLTFLCEFATKAGKCIFAVRRRPGLQFCTFCLRRSPCLHPGCFKVGSVATMNHHRRVPLYHVASLKVLMHVCVVNKNSHIPH